MSLSAVEEPRQPVTLARSFSGSTFDEAIYTTATALPIAGSQSLRTVMKAESAVTRNSDHKPRNFYDLEHEHPIQPRKK